LVKISDKAIYRSLSLSRLSVGNRSGYRCPISIVAGVFHMEMGTISTTVARKWLGCTSQTIRNLIKEEKLGAVQLEKERGQKDVI
jgi:hypothetical protein